MSYGFASNSFKISEAHIKSGTFSTTSPNRSHYPPTTYLKYFFLPSVGHLLRCRKATAQIFIFGVCPYSIPIFCPRFGKYPLPPMLQAKRKRRPKPTSHDLHYVSMQEPTPSGFLSRGRDCGGFFYWWAVFLGLGCRGGERVSGERVVGGKCYTLFWKLGRSWTCKMGGVLQTVAGILHFSLGVVSFTTCKGNNMGVILQVLRHNLQECELLALFCVTRPARLA